MSTIIDDEIIKNIDVTSLFMDNYEIPIYQRNYAWKYEQIEQLVDDIIDVKENESSSNYYIGSLVVNKKNDIYEVVDGQQRLTTLFLLMSYLGMKPQQVLRFEARDKSNRLLRVLATITECEDYAFQEEHEISQGFENIKSIFKNKHLANGEKIDKNSFRKKLGKVHIVRIQVPQNIDLNHYFEIMNTRGEQLELHEIAKCKILEKLSAEERIVANIIWEACANMGSYLHMNLSPSQKSALLTEGRDELKKDIDTFDNVVASLKKSDGKILTYSLDDFFICPEDPNKVVSLSVNDTEKAEIDEDEDKGSRRFESIIGFPQFLLHINAVLKSTPEDESSLDDKRLLTILGDNWNSAEESKIFLFEVLKCRLLFDKYIIKRDKKLSDSGRWSLMRSKKYNAKNSVYYVGTFNDSQQEDETDSEEYSAKETSKNLLCLQSALRVTYTSPKTMHWITELLRSCNSQIVTADGLLKVAEKYAVSKIKDGYRYNGTTIQEWSDLQRIVFTYLDYLLYRDGYSYENIHIDVHPTFEFQFRSSIEHFYPQHPIIGIEACDPEILNCFGNLALLTVSGNSAVSNHDPVAKKADYKEIMKQSLKLQIMCEMIGDDSTHWRDKSLGENNLAIIHQQQMFEILDNEVKRYIE